LDKTIMTIDQRSPIILGSKNEVERSVRVLQSSAS
jgi:fructose-1,6-bisphosphatase